MRIRPIIWPKGGGTPLKNTVFPLPAEVDRSTPQWRPAASNITVVGAERTAPDQVKPVCAAVPRDAGHEDVDLVAFVYCRARHQEAQRGTSPCLGPVHDVDK
jgi:hypothetical protein